MNKEQQIDQMAKIVCNACRAEEDQISCGKKPCYLAKREAEELYKAGYRKLPIMDNLDTEVTQLSERFEMFTPDRVFVKKNLLYGIVYYVDKQAIARKGYIYAAALNAFLGIDTNEVKK